MAALLDIDQLRTFVAIADSGSFTRAADVVHKTQSAVSMQMKRLEERLGKPVFERDGRHSRLTEDGERLLDYARRMLRLNSECIASFADAELAGRVRLGVPDDYADRYLPEILARFSRSNPKVEVTVVCEPSPMLIERLQADGERPGRAGIGGVNRPHPVQPMASSSMIMPSIMLRPICQKAGSFASSPKGFSNSP